ncbi:hypothetical protein PF001_g12000 [Phytophthora fragariae]|uniref:Peptidase S33 tripeptidyl aminopeptidase-like C-terminal domain-containing protein n=2 Tax=Phytophthora fragariae TaxID=53985 RepID=A0A6A4DJW3_9STRA|nr:hypothetical protein PF003_g23542 [Phytophthora fragariae]KAE8936113.1 hypothetical protein PF009_g13954 [Phytophthora fragariae]KAE9306679.1 hypothetical protein PF001_g12000 [Phytophthora fragariae]
MVTLHSQLEGAVNVYTMDHRGTGRSTRLDCVAAQATTTGSPCGSQLDPSEVPACAQDLHNKYGDLASFSVTTAATDLATFISTYTNGADTTVYGVSYGTVLVERLMSLAPPESDSDFGEVGEAFLSLCDHDNECKTRFARKSLNKTLDDLFHQFDKDPNSTCAMTSESATNPSSFLRVILSMLLPDMEMRNLIPPIVYRLQRCGPEDVDILTHLVTTLSSSSATPQDSAFQSSLLYNLIVFSELWETPASSNSELQVRFGSTKINSGGVYNMNALYCASSKDKSAACDDLNVGSYDGDGIIYKRDHHWNKTVTIPSQASVLLLSGKLDPQTPHKYAEVLLGVLDGDNKELVAFDYASHDAVATTQMIAGDPQSETCGMKILASYVRNGGDLQRMDKSCVEQMPAFNMTTSEDYVQHFLSTNEAYDGAFDSSLSSNSN